MKNGRIFILSHMVVAGIAMVAVAMNILQRDAGNDDSVVSDNSAIEQQIEASAQNIAMLSQSLSKIEKKLARLENVQRLPSEQTVFAPVQAQAATTEDDTSGIMPTDEQDSGLVAEGELDFQDYQQRFASESFDADWSLDTETSALAALTEHEIENAELSAVECYQSACLLEFQHLDGESDSLLVEHLQASAAFAGEFFATTIIDSDGSMRTVMVVGQADETLVE